MEEMPYEIPRIPASAGALIFDGASRLLILKPTYKAGWTIPGGQVEAGGETPWEACRREAREESGVEIDSGRLACVDFLRPREGRPGGMRFLFDCGVLDAENLRQVEVQAGEIAEFGFVPIAEALELPERAAPPSSPRRLEHPHVPVPGGRETGRQCEGLSRSPEWVV